MDKVVHFEIPADDVARAQKFYGGKTVRGKEAVGDMGYAAYFSDSEGNVVGLWQSK